MDQLRGEGKAGWRGRSGGVLGKGVLLKTLLCSWLSSVADCTLINGWEGEGSGVTRVAAEIEMESRSNNSRASRRRDELICAARGGERGREEEEEDAGKGRRKL